MDATSRWLVRLRAAVERVGGEGRDAEDRRKRSFFVIALAILIPALLAHGTADLLRGDVPGSLPALLLTALLAATLACARRVPRIEHAVRFLIPVTLACLVRVVAAAGGDAFVFLWAYLLPISVFFVFGWREGALWAALIGVATGTALAAAQSLPPPLITRFLVTYLLVALFAAALETARAASSRLLLARQSALEAALRKIKTLTGLLPICCSCKKIRDDRGEWSRLEDYLGAHTEAELTHGICPECIGRIYPGLAERMPKSAARRPAPPAPV